MIIYQQSNIIIIQKGIKSLFRRMQRYRQHRQKLFLIRVFLTNICIPIVDYLVFHPITKINLDFNNCKNQNILIIYQFLYQLIIIIYLNMIQMMKFTLTIIINIHQK